MGVQAGALEQKVRQSSKSAPKIVMLPKSLMKFSPRVPQAIIEVPQTILNCTPLLL